MKKWQVVLCSMGLSFIPVLIAVLGYAISFIRCGWELSIVPFLTLPLGAVFSYLIYLDSEELIDSQ